MDNPLDDLNAILRLGGMGDVEDLPPGVVSSYHDALKLAAKGDLLTLLRNVRGHIDHVIKILEAQERKNSR